MDASKNAARGEPSSRGRRALFRAGYFAFHASCLGVFLLDGVRVLDAVTFFVSFSVRMFCLTAVMHRYFAHRAYQMQRGLRLLLAAIGCLAAQKGPLWWSYTHGIHHRFSDGDGDPHSPWLQGRWLAQVDWLGSPSVWRLDLERVPASFRECRELVALEKLQGWLLASFVLALAAWSGWRGILWGFCAPTVVIWHGIQGIGIFGHRFGGSQRYPTRDQSRNKWLLAVFTLGEGWHNNHHYFPWSARVGLFWYEYDPTFWGLKVLSWLGLVSELRVPSRSAIEGAEARSAA